MVLTREWAKNWRLNPTAAVLIAAANGAANPSLASIHQQYVTGSQLELLTASAARRFALAGVRPGDRVLLSCASSIETVLAYVGILRLGAVVVPANIGYTSAELEHVVTDSTPVLAVIDDPSRVSKLPLGVTRPSLDALPIDTGLSIELDAPHDAPAMIAYTSGTTGRPKGALLSRGNLLAGSQVLVSEWAWTSDDRLVHALPMFHMHGLGVGLNATFTAGASIVVVPRFDVGDVVAAVRDHEATMFFGVPTMYARFRDADRLADLSGLRLLVSGSAPLDPVLFAAIADEAGQAPIERYGMSETVMLTSNPVQGQRKAGSVGRPLAGVSVRLDDEGGVQVSGPNVFSGYWGRVEETSEAFTDDGWFRTGDIGEWDDDGYLYLIGRASDLIITGGYNVYPREVEDALREHASVIDVAVVGLPDDTWGETVAAFIVTRDDSDIDLSALEQVVGERLAAYKRPRTWRRVNELPRNAMGKVRRDVLREQERMKA
ncbi:MAG: AMP-binding protein [Actinomycetes bacterium]